MDAGPRMAVLCPKRGVDIVLCIEQLVPELDLKAFRFQQKGLHCYGKFLTLQHIA